MRGFTGKIVRVAGGAKSTVAKGLLSVGGPGGVFATGVDGVSVSPDGKVYGVMTSGPPAQVKSFPRPFRNQAGRLFDLTDGNLSAVANISALEWKRNLDKFKRDRNSNPYAVLALADRQIVVDAGANAVLQVQDGKVSLLAVIPRNGKAQAVPTSVALGPDGDLYVGELAEGAGKGKARVWKVPAAGGTPTVHARASRPSPAWPSARTAACSSRSSPATRARRTSADGSCASRPTARGRSWARSS